MMLTEEKRQEFLQRGFSRRNFGRLAAMLTAGATLPFYNEPALAQLSRIENVPPDAVMINANENPLGRHIRLGDDSSPWSEIVGVVSEVSEYMGQDRPRPHIFAPFLARPDPTMCLVVRTRTEPTSFAASLRRAVWALDKDQAVTDVQSMEHVVRNSWQGDDLMAELMGTFAAIALTIATIGIYGLLAYLVGQRTHEIGVRMALGARPSEVLALVMRGAMFLALSGVAAGFLVSLGLPRLFAASFTGFDVHSGWILTGTPLAVILVALASCYVPARRAAKVDPMVALRYE